MQAPLLGHRAKRALIRALPLAAVFAILFIGLFSLANYHYLREEIGYRLGSVYAPTTLSAAEAAPTPPLTSPPPPSSPPPPPTTSPSPSLRPTVVPSSRPLPSSSPLPLNDQIIIPRIGVKAPIIWDISADQTEANLHRGVTHLAGSPRPGQVGNLFLTGHSSDYIWKHDPYANVFALLPHLQKGDQIVLAYAGQKYTYEVTSTLIVTPDQVEVANPTPTPTLTLLTCYPIGTSLKRYIVHAAYRS